jgi:predicted aminopeptidase
MPGKVGKIIRRVFIALLAVLVVLAAIYWELIVYGIRQGKGQLHIIWNAKPVEEYLQNPNFPDSLKAKLVLINEVRRYAIDSLGLKDTKN